MQLERIVAKDDGARWGAIVFPNSEEPLSAAQISAFAGIHADLLAFIDERRHLHHQPGLELGGLGDAGSSSRLEPRLCLYDGQFHGSRQLNAHSLAVMVTHLDEEVRR